jgi:copper transport protein
MARGARRARRAAVASIAALLALVALLAGAAPVSAHTNFVASEPPDSAVLTGSPATVVLEFDRLVAIPLATVSLVDAEGHAHPVSGLSVQPGHPTGLVVALPHLPRDAYRLSYEVRDLVDLHLTSGSLVFGAGAAASLPAGTSSASPPRPSEVVLQWLGYTGLFVLLGGLVVGLRVVPRCLDRADPATPLLQRRLARLALLGVAGSLVAEAGLLLLHVADIGWSWGALRTVLVDSGFGHRWIGVTAVLLGLPPVLRSRLRPAAAVACALAVTECVLLGISGHTGDSASPSVVGIAVRSVHLLAAGIWAGGIVALIVAWTALRRLRVAPGTGARLLRGFGGVAAAGLLGAGVTGLLLAGSQVETVTALLATTYGTVLVAKVVLLLGLGGLGLRHARVGNRRRAAASGASQRLPRTLPVEAVGAVAVVLLASFLGASSPPRGAEFRPAPPATPTALNRTVDDLVVGVSIKPNRPGRNLLALDVLQTRFPARAPVQAVSVQVGTPRGDVVLATRPSGTHYDAGALDLAAPGALALRVTVQRPGLPAVELALPWVVDAPPPARHPTVLSDAPLALPAEALAGGVTALGGGVALAAALRRRRPRTPACAPVAGGRDAA